MNRWRYEMIDLDAFSTKDSTMSNQISKKIAKILESKIETDKDMLDALQTTSALFDKNTLKNRRNFRRDIERQSLDNRDSLENFCKVKEEMDSIVSNVSSMNRWCNEMNDPLQAAKTQTRDLLDQTTNFQAESKLADKRAEIAQTFLAQFQLHPNESKALKGTNDGGISKDFFAALARTREIHDSCKDLLMSGQNAAGLEIMNTMANYQENAYELLYRWVQREFRLLNIDAVEINPLLCESVKALQDRPVLLKYSFDEFCIARRSHIVKSFIDALTKGGSGGMPKPIELLSHDPLRYIGDMLAWIQQAFASEKELTTNLLRMCADEVCKDNLAILLSQTTEGLCRPFTIRVEQVLGIEYGPVDLYKLSNLFTFYYEKIAPSVVETSPFLYALNELRELLTSNLHSSNPTVRNGKNRYGRVIERFLSGGVYWIIALLYAQLGLTDGFNRTPSIAYNFTKRGDLEIQGRATPSVEPDKDSGGNSTLWIVLGTILAFVFIAIVSGLSGWKYVSSRKKRVIADDEEKAKRKSIKTKRVAGIEDDKKAPVEQVKQEPLIAEKKSYIIIRVEYREQIRPDAENMGQQIRGVAASSSANFNMETYIEELKAFFKGNFTSFNPNWITVLLPTTPSERKNTNRCVKVTVMPGKKEKVAFDGDVTNCPPPSLAALISDAYEDYERAVNAVIKKLEVTVIKS